MYRFVAEVGCVLGRERRDGPEDGGSLSLVFLSKLLERSDACFTWFRGGGGGFGISMHRAVVLEVFLRYKWQGGCHCVYACFVLCGVWVCGQASAPKVPGVKA